MADSPEILDELEALESIAIPDVLPVMALKDAVLFPFVIIPLTVAGRSRCERSMKRWPEIA